MEYREGLAAIIILSTLTAIASSLVTASGTPSAISPVKNTVGALGEDITGPTEKLRENTRVLITISITNDTGDNIENVLIREQATSVFENAIGGENAKENLLWAAEALDNAAKSPNSYFENAGENFRMAENLVREAAPNVDTAADELNAAITTQPMIGWNDNVTGPIDIAKNLLLSAAGEMDNSVSNYYKIAEYFENAGDNLDSAAGTGIVSENLATWYSIEVGENLKLAATALQNVGTNLRNAHLDNAAENLVIAALRLVDTGTNLKDNFIGQSSGINMQEAGQALLLAGNKLDNAAWALENVGTCLEDAADHLAIAVGHLRTADENLLEASGALENAAIALENVADNLIAAAIDNWSPFSGCCENFVCAGQKLENMADNLDNADNLLGDVLGQDELNAAATYLKSAGENFGDITAVDFSEAGDALISASSSIRAAATVMTNTANQLSPASWYMVDDVMTAYTHAGAEEGDVMFHAIGALGGEYENCLAPGASADFSFIWSTPNLADEEKSYTVRVYLYNTSGTQRGKKDLTFTVDGKLPSLTITVTQLNVGVNNVVGDIYKARDNADNGTGLITITSSEELSSIGKVWIKDYDNTDNWFGPITQANLETADNTIFYYVFDVVADGTWDNENLCVVVDNAVDLVGVENSAPDNTKFIVDTIAPIIIDNCLGEYLDRYIPGDDTTNPGLKDNMWIKKKAGTDENFFVDNVATKVLKGRVEDDWDVTNTSLWARTLDTTTYDNTDDINVVFTTIYWNTHSVVPMPTALDNFTDNITLDEGANTVWMEVIDWTGHRVVGENVDNIILDTHNPGITEVSIGNTSFITPETDNIWVKHTGPSISLKVTDPGYADGNALGVFRENIELRLFFADNGAFLYMVDNSNVYDATTGVFENSGLMRDWKSALQDGTYNLEVKANDNLNEGVSENYLFNIDSVAPNLAGQTPSILWVLDPATMITCGPITQETTLKVKGTSAEVYSIINIYYPENTLLATTTSDVNRNFVVDITLSEGKNRVLYITEVDRAGNESIKEHLATLTVDATAPVVTLTAPKEGTTTSDASIKVTGTAVDWVTGTAGGVVFDWDEITVTIDATGAIVGKTVYLSADGSFSATVPLEEGTNVITVRATDGAGNISQAIDAQVTVERTVTPWTMYAMIAAIIAIIVAAIAVLRRR